MFNLKNKEGKIDSKFIAVSSIVVVLLLAYFVYAASTTATLRGSANSSTVYFSTHNNTYNFSVTSASALYNFTQVNFTLSASSGAGYLNFSFGTNTTTASAATAFFTNWTGGGWENLSYGNTTGIVVPGGTTRYFTFVANNSIDGGYIINITTLDDAGTPAIQRISFNITIDSVNPTMNITAPGIINNTNQTANAIPVNVTSYDLNIVNVTFTLMDSSFAILNNTILSTSTGNVSLNWTGLSNGIYYFNVTVMDYALNKINSSRVKVAIDTLAPAVTVTRIGNYTNVTSQGTAIINVTIIDATTSIGTVTFNITNGTVGALVNSSTGVRAGNTWTINLTNISTGCMACTFYHWPEGMYNLTIYVDDSLGNVNNSVRVPFAVDRTAPAIWTSATVIEQTLLSFRINTTDAISDVGALCTVNRSGTMKTPTIGNIWNIQDVGDTGLTCGTSYSYNVTCTDSSGNRNSTLFTQSTSDCSASSSTSTGGSSSSVPATTDLTTTGYTKSMIVAEEVKFKLGTQQHSVFVQSIVGTTVTLKISSAPQMITLKVGEEKNVNLDNDSYYDLNVKINSVLSGAASVSIKSIHEAVPGTPAAVEEEAAAAEAAAASEETAGMSSTARSLMWVGIGIVIIIIIAAAIYFMARKRKE